MKSFNASKRPGTFAKNNKVHQLVVGALNAALFTGKSIVKKSRFLRMRCSHDRMESTGRTHCAPLDSMFQRYDGFGEMKNER